MRKLTIVPALLAAQAALAGCASLGLTSAADHTHALSWKEIRSSAGAVIVAETPAPAPAGLASFCERFADVCEESTVAAQASPYGHWIQPASWSMGASPILAWTPVPNEDGAATFARLLQMRMQGLAYSHPRSEVELTEQLWRELGHVNLEVNHSIAAATDAARYGLNEYWAMPLTQEHRAGEPVQGDCEDYALEKRAQLIALGWNPAALALAVAYAPGIGNHAVLIAQTDHGDFVLDNLFDDPRSPQMLDYGWVSRQAGAMTTWASARVEFAPALEQPRDSLLASRDHQGPLLARLSTAPAKTAS